MNIHLYMLCYRFEALVASHLEPEAFGRYMAIGTQKNTRGNVLFFEIDPSLKSDFFKLDNLQERCTPHIDGSPKRSKYISVYRVLEHLPLSVFGKLHLCTADGRVLSLDPSPYDVKSEKPGSNLYEELCPVYPLVVHRVPLAPQQHMQPPIAKPRLLQRQLPQFRAQRTIIAPCSIPIRAHRQQHQRTRPPLAEGILRLHLLDSCLPGYELQPFFRITDCSASLSSVRSATNRFSRAFSSRICRSSCAWLTSSPPYFAFQA